MSFNKTSNWNISPKDQRTSLETKMCWGFYLVNLGCRWDKLYILRAFTFHLSVSHLSPLAVASFQVFVKSWRVLCSVCLPLLHSQLTGSRWDTRAPLRLIVPFKTDQIENFRLTSVAQLQDWSICLQTDGGEHCAPEIITEQNIKMYGSEMQNLSSLIVFGIADEN